MKTMESFISLEPSPFSMAKDSELVREVENFLRENNIKKYIIKYDRGIEVTKHTEHPLFEIETSNLKALKGLCEKLAVPLKDDYYRMHRSLTIENGKYSIYLYNKMPCRDSLAV